MENSRNYLSQKLGFIVGFLVALITLYSLFPNLAGTKINLVSGTTSFGDLLIIFLVFLLLSIYFYALIYVRYDFPKLQEIKWLKYLETIAHSFYLIAILIYPLLVAVAFLLNEMGFRLKKIIPRHIQDLNYSITAFITLIGGISIILTFISQIKLLRKNAENFAVVLKEKELESFMQAKEAYKKGDYDFVPFLLYKSIERIILSKMALLYGIGASKMFSRGELLRLAIQNNLIPEEYINFINDLRKIRNEFAHDSRSLNMTKENTSHFLEKTQNLINIINSKR